MSGRDLYFHLKERPQRRSHKVAERARAMAAAMADAHGVFQPSNFWRELSAENLRMIEVRGIENFRRSLPQNYFNPRSSLSAVLDPENAGSRDLSGDRRWPISSRQQRPKTVDAVNAP